MVCCGVPAVDHTELVQLAEKHFSSPSLHDDGSIPKKTPCRFTGSEVSQCIAAVVSCYTWSVVTPDA